MKISITAVVVTFIAFENPAYAEEINTSEENYVITEIIEDESNTIYEIEPDGLYNIC